LIGSIGHKGNNKKDNMKNNLVGKNEWKVELLFVEPAKEMKGFVLLFLLLVVLLVIILLSL